MVLTRGLRSELFLRRDKTRLEATSRIGSTGTRLLFSDPFARENPGNSVLNKKFPVLFFFKYKTNQDQFFFHKKMELRWYWEEDVSKCSGPEISQIFPGKIKFPSREMAFGNQTSSFNLF